MTVIPLHTCLPTGHAYRSAKRHDAIKRRESMLLELRLKLAATERGNADWWSWYLQWRQRTQHAVWECSYDVDTCGSGAGMHCNSVADVCGGRVQRSIAQEEISIHVQACDDCEDTSFCIHAREGNSIDVQTCDVHAREESGIHVHACDACEENSINVHACDDCEDTSISVHAREEPFSENAIAAAARTAAAANGAIMDAASVRSAGGTTIDASSCKALDMPPCTVSHLRLCGQTSTNLNSQLHLEPQIHPGLVELTEVVDSRADSLMNEIAIAKCCHDEQAALHTELHGNNRQKQPTSQVKMLVRVCFAAWKQQMLDALDGWQGYYGSLAEALMHCCNSECLAHNPGPGSEPLMRETFTAWSSERAGLNRT